MWDPLRILSAAIDDALAEFASSPLDYLDERNREKAMQDPEFAGISEKQDNSTHKSLNWEDLQRQWDILERTRDNPWWEKPLKFLTQRPMTSALREIQFAWQRVSRGWDDSATWSLDVHLARLLSEQLNHLADTTHGWPGEPDGDFPHFEDWQFALRENALKLRVYADGKFSVPDAGLASSESDLNAVLEEQYSAAQEAMRWVADNFGSLWD